jgi:protein-S-isoprenylcysteine O-methyltransferase Ste14
LPSPPSAIWQMRTINSVVPAHRLVFCETVRDFGSQIRARSEGAGCGHVSALPNSRLERRLQKLMDFGERTFFLLLYAIFVTSLSRSLASRPYNILALISEGLIVFFTIVRRDARMVTTRPGDWLVALLGTALPLLVRAGGHTAAPLLVGTALMVAGLLISIYAKLTLRRSFGLAAANRGVVVSGPYRIVRHPIYTGYILMYVGFLLNNPLAWNLALYLLAIGLLILRVMAEEIVLRQDPQYLTLLQRVHYRLMPGVF